MKSKENLNWKISVCGEGEKMDLIIFREPEIIYENIIIDCVKKYPGLTVRKLSNLYHYALTKEKITKDYKIATSYKLLPALRKMEKDNILRMDRSNKRMKIFLGA